MRYIDSLAFLPLLIWAYILLGRGKFWNIKPTVRSGALLPIEKKRVVAVVPARNEAGVIGDSIESLLNQDFEPKPEVIVVNDDSTDETVALARDAGERSGQSQRLTILHGKTLAPGWTGKLWALSQGVEHALTLNPDYILLTDADIRHGRNSLRRLVEIAESEHCDLASFMVRLACKSLAEKALIPAFVFFFLQLYPPAWIASSKRRTAGAAGGCVLIRPEALAGIGGLQAIRGAVIDDCSLARAVKRNGGRLWMGLTEDTYSIRSYHSFGEIGRMVSRTAFSQLHHSNLLLVATLAGLLVTYLAPPLLLLVGRPVPVALGLTSWLLMAFCYRPMVRFYGLPGLWATTLPAVALFYAGATVRSAVLYWMGKGGEWKNRAQDARHLGDD
jgi:hopene-associated glycosyltransferase HpnB